MYVERFERDFYANVVCCSLEPMCTWRTGEASQLSTSAVRSISLYTNVLKDFTKPEGLLTFNFWVAGQFQNFIQIYKESFTKSENCEVSFTSLQKCKKSFHEGRNFPIFNSLGGRHIFAKKISWGEKISQFSILWVAAGVGPIIICLLALAFLSTRYDKISNSTFFWQISKWQRPLHKNVHIFHSLAWHIWMPVCGKYNPGQTPLTTIYDTSVPACAHNQI